MLEATKSLLLIFSAIFPIVDPIGGSPFFLALTKDSGSEARKALARRIALDSFFLLVGSYFIGTYILAFFGISLPVVQVGGGMVLVAMGWAALMNDDGGCDTSARKTIEAQEDNRAFYPLTLPLTVGPGSISVAVTLGANAARRHTLHPVTILTAFVALALIALSIFLCYGFADHLGRMLGRTGMTVVTKLASFLLVCIGVQIGWNGIKELLESVALHMT